MIPIICVVGRSNSGKTTVIANLIPKLKKLGYKVATVKHDPHGADLDVNGKDSWILSKSGSDITFVSGPGQFAQFKYLDRDIPLKELAGLAWECDFLIAEGYKDSPYPKVEVLREETGLETLCKEAQLTAVVCDSPINISTRKFSTKEMGKLARFIADTYIKPSYSDLSTDLLINDLPITLNPFAKHLFARAILGMALALKGVSKIRRLAIYVKDDSDKTD